VKFSLHIPLGEIAPGEFQTPQAVAEMTAALERVKADACYVTDHPAPMADWLHANGHDAPDPFTALAFAAAHSTRLRLHTNILVLPYRNPFLTAKAAATLQVLSGGRLILGVGAGYQKGEFEALGVDFHKRGALTDEALEVLNLAWAGGAVVKQGIGFNAAGVEPRPAPNPAPTLWIGGGSDKAVERAARWGDGWCPFMAAPTLSANNRASAVQSVQELSEKIQRVHELREALGRTGPFDVLMGPQSRGRTNPQTGAQEYLQQFGELAEVGVNWTRVDIPHPSRAAYLENVQWFAEEVMAKV